MKKLIVLSLLLTGCAETIVDRDFEKEEQAFIKANGVRAKDPMYSPPTPDTIIAGKEEGVKVIMYKGASTITRDKVELQNWYAILKNYNKVPKCVSVSWKLMDFEMLTDYPEMIYLKSGEEILNYAVFKQRIWNLDGTRFALPPSGYVGNMLVIDPDPKTGCTFNEKTVDER